jgi:hypothetical protein
MLPEHSAEGLCIIPQSYQDKILRAIASGGLSVGFVILGDRRERIISALGLWERDPSAPLRTCSSPLQPLRLLRSYQETVLA